MFAHVIWVVALLLVTGVAAEAATFTENDGGANASSSIIRADGTGDYQLLGEAAADFNAFPGGAKGPYTFYIDSDTTEAGVVAFGNATNGHTVALRPIGAPRTVIFAGTVSYESFPGGLLIGTPTTDYREAIKTDGFLIDGSLDDTTGALTFRTVVEDVQDGRVGTYVVTVVGDSDDVTIQNCRVHNYAEHPEVRFGHGIAFSTLPRFFNNPDVLLPDSGTVRNCEIVATGRMGGEGVGLRLELSLGIMLPGMAPRDFLVEDCSIEAASGGILLGICSSAVLRNNLIRIVSPAEATVAHGILAAYDSRFRSVRGCVLYSVQA